MSSVSTRYVAKNQAELAPLILLPIALINDVSLKMNETKSNIDDISGAILKRIGISGTQQSTTLNKLKESYILQGFVSILKLESTLNTP